MISAPISQMLRLLFVDWMYVTLRENYEAKKSAVYTNLGYDLKGNKDILGLWLHQTESKNRWMQIFDELKSRDVEDVFFYLHGWCFWPRRRRKNDFPFRGCSTFVWLSCSKYITLYSK